MNLLFGYEGNRLAATACHHHFKGVIGSDCAVVNHVCRRIGVKVSIRSIGIYGCIVAHTGLKEVEFHCECTCILIRSGAKEVFLACAAHDSHKFTRLSLKCPLLVAVGFKIAEELECRVTFIVLYTVRSHLHR